MSDYLDSLKRTDLRPKKVKVVEKEEHILLEEDPVSASDSADDIEKKIMTQKTFPVGGEKIEEIDRGESDIHAEIIKWFFANPYPKDDAVHAFAEKLGMDPDKFEGHIYMVLSSILSEGRSKGKDIKHDPKELDMGIKVEMEHTTNPIISRKIAMDHLVEIPDYYTRLAKMEKEAGAKEH